MARFRLSGHNLRIETGSHEGLPRNERSCRRCNRLVDEDFVAAIDDEQHLLSCERKKDIRLRFAGLLLSSLRGLMQCEDVGSVAWFVHECMDRQQPRVLICNNNNNGKGRQQSYWLIRGQQCNNVTASRHGAKAFLGHEGSGPHIERLQEEPGVVQEPPLVDHKC
jgi:hypothetical protein